MAKLAGTRLRTALAAFMLLFSMAFAPQAAAASPRTVPVILPDTGQVVAVALPNTVMNGEFITFYGMCVNPGEKAVTSAGFYVGSDEANMKRIDCAQAPSALSGAASAYFDATMSLPDYANGTYKAFVQCGGREYSSDVLPFNALPPLPPPVVDVQEGAKLTASELTLSWEDVKGAAYYGIRLRDITKGAGGTMLLGDDSDDTESAWHWVDGRTTHVSAGAWRSKLVAGHAYRLTVASAYDKQTVYGKSIDFQVISKAEARGIAPMAETGLYCKNEDGTVSLYGAVDNCGRPLKQYGFYVGKAEKSMVSRHAEDPYEYAGGAYSMTISVGGNTRMLYYRAYAMGENGKLAMGELKKIDLGQNDPFTPEEKAAAIDKAYVPLLAAIDPGWSFNFIKLYPYNYSNTEIQLLGDWESQHILKGFAFPGKPLSINTGAAKQFETTRAYLNDTKVKVTYKDGSVSAFRLKELVQTAASYNSRYIFPTIADGNGNKLPPYKWNWRLSLHSWGVSVDVNALMRVNRQKGINFAAIQGGAAKLSHTAGTNRDGAVCLSYDGYPQPGRLVPDDVCNYILYELAFKKAGFYWGTYFGNNRTDPMHFTLIEVPARRDIPLERAKVLPNE